MSLLTPSTTTTSIVTGTPKNASWLTMAPYRWLEPEKSVGAPHSSLDLRGKYKCWSLRENGPAHILWKDLSKTIWSLLQEQIEHLDARDSVVLFQIFMVGKELERTSPTVVFSSKNETLRKRAMRLVEKKVILGKHPGVLVAHSSRIPRPLAIEDNISLLNLPEGIYAKGPLESCGISVHIVAKGRPPRRATIGGFVLVNSEYYGLTTAHAFAEPEPPSPKEDSEFDFGFSVLGEPDDSSDDEDYLLELTSKESVSSTSSDVYTSSTICEDDFIENSVKSTANISSVIEVGQKAETSSEGKNSDPPPERALIKIGTLYATSSPETSLDWALVKIDIKTFVSLTRDQHTKDKYGWTESAQNILNNDLPMLVYRSPQWQQISIAKIAHDAKILICYARDEFEAFAEGRLSAISSYTKSPASIKFQELWTIKLDHSSLIDGDCGSWVLDAQTGQVYGHVVSGYAGGAAYIIPAYQIVQDIQRLLGEYVEFPKRQHLDRAVDKAQESLPIGRASMTPGPPPPPLSSIRTGPAPPPTPPGMHMGPAPTPPSPGMCGPMFIRQQSIRIQDLTPPKVMDESVCLKKLTTYSAYTIRKCPPRDPKKGRGTWARAEVIEENLSQEEIIKQIKKLNEKGRSVGDKKKALAPNQQGQVTALITDLVSKETDKAFEWSLVQLDSIVKPVSSKKGKRGGALYETVTMTIFAKRAPLKDLNPVILLQNIEKMKAESMRALKPPPQAGGKSGTSHEAIFELDRKSTKKPAQGRSKKFNEDDYSSTDDSFDSDTDSLFSYGSESFVTSISSKSRSTSRRHSIGNLRSYSRHREFRTAYNTEQPGHPFSPDLHSEAFGASPRPHVPDDPTIMASASFDPVAAAYEAGKADFEAERHGTADRIFPQPVERVIGRVVDPRPGGSYKSRETHYSETRYDPDNRSLDDRRQDESFLRRREEADEEYIESRLDGRVGGRRPSRPSDFVDRTDSFYDRRPSKPTIWDNRHPFAPPPVSRRYPPSSESDPPSMISDRTSTSNTSAPPSDSGW